MLAFQVLMPQVFRRTTPMMAILTVELYGKVYCWTKRKILASSFIELLVHPNQRTLGLLNILTTRSYTFIQQDSLAAKLASINVVRQLVIGVFWPHFWTLYIYLTRFFCLLMDQHQGGINMTKTLKGKCHPYLGLAITSSSSTTY